MCLQCERPGFDPWVGKISWRRAWQPTPVFLPRNAHGQRNLESYSPWGRKESDTMGQLSAQCMNGSTEISCVLTCNQGLILGGKMWSFYLPSWLLFPWAPFKKVTEYRGSLWGGIGTRAGSRINLLIVYLLSIFYILGTTLGAGDKMVNSVDKSLFLPSKSSKIINKVNKSRKFKRVINTRKKIQSR